MTHNITVEGGTSVRLPTAGKYCDRDIVITATGGGGEGSGNVLEEELTITQACANAREVYDLFVSYLPEGVVSAMFEWIGDMATAENNQFIFGSLLFTNGANASTSRRMLYMRYRSGSLGSLTNSGSEYDLVLSVGDKVRMIVAI